MTHHPDKAREAAALVIARDWLDDQGIHDLAQSDPSGTILDTTRRAIDAFLAASVPADEKLAEIQPWCPRCRATSANDKRCGSCGTETVFQARDISIVRTLVTALSAKLKEVEGKLAWHVMLGRVGAKALNLTTDELDTVEAEVERLRRLVFVPGMWKCAKCSFVAMHMVLRAADGAVGVKADSETEICPNGCGPLWPVTERDAGNDLADRLEKVTLERNAAESQLTAQKAAHAKMLRDEADKLHKHGRWESASHIRRLADKIEGGE